MPFSNYRKLKESYNDGETPAPDELQGEYFVTAPAFPGLSLGLLRHRKNVDPDGEGENLLLDDFRFGKFVLDERDEALVSDNDNDENTIMLRGVGEKIRRIEDGRLIGKRYYKMRGKGIFLMLFEMEPA